MATFMPGQIILTGFSKQLVGWILCQGQLLNISDYHDLYLALGTAYGGDGATTFGVPDLRGSLPIGVGKGTAKGATNHLIATEGGQEAVTLAISQVPSHDHLLAASASASTTAAFSNSVVYGSDPTQSNKHYLVPEPNSSVVKLDLSSLSEEGDSQAHPNVMPTMGLTYQICTTETDIPSMSYAGQIEFFPYGFTPKNYLPCDGAEFSIFSFEELFYAIGVTFGQKDNNTIFKVPNLQGRVAAGVGMRPGNKINWSQGMTSGNSTASLTMNTYPQHTHQLQAIQGSVTQGVATQNLAFGGFSHSLQPAAPTNNPKTYNFHWVANSNGGDHPHDNLQPYLVLAPCICSAGERPVFA